VFFFCPRKNNHVLTIEKKINAAELNYIVVPSGASKEVMKNVQFDIQTIFFLKRKLISLNTIHAPNRGQPA